ncbi:MAG: efflux RND transporter periplasmic adaptor subunit [Opitutales bacterium]|nr:efflux RND transporter periplasmic adaptor subunit [Opitutales bacterium]
MKKMNIRNAAAALAALAALAGGCSDKSAPSMANRAPVEVRVAKPICKSVEFWDNYTARLDAVAFVEIRARVGGYLQKVCFKEGQKVAAGDLLFVIDPRPYEAALAAAKAQVGEVEARLALAKNNDSRAKELFAAKAISKETYETRSSELLSADAALLAAKARLRDAELNLEFTRIHAPMSGMVSESFVDEGNLVAANSTLLTNIVKSDVIQAYFEISERDQLRYKKTGLFREIDPEKKTGPRVKITLLDDGTQREGKLTYFDNRMGKATSSLTMRADIDNSDGLLAPGMFAKISVLGESSRKVLLVPEDIIGTDLVNRYVYTVGADGVVQYKEVKVGRLFGKYRVIEEGLSEGDRVVAVGLQRVMPGMKVSAKDMSFEAE